MSWLTRVRNALPFIAKKRETPGQSVGTSARAADRWCSRKE